ncbi:MAG: hypothetical protein Q8K79_12065 [Solirubrobacteraceae bacterium]|nr:hypothetical protein [Solirubrobacteraceae bacterium]
MTHLNSRVARIVAGLAVASAFAAAPMAAQAADTDATGTLTGGSLTNTAPVIESFTATLTGVNQTVTTDVGAWSVNDARGDNLGYNITLAATAPTVDGSAPEAGTGGSLTMGATTATPAAGNPATTAPVSSSQLLSTTAATIDAAAPGTAQGQWEFAPDADNLSVVIPGNASAGAYSSTLTYTAAALAV